MNDGHAIRCQAEKPLRRGIDRDLQEVGQWTTLGP